MEKLSKQIRELTDLVEDQSEEIGDLKKLITKMKREVSSEEYGSERESDREAEREKELGDYRKRIKRLRRTYLD